MWRVARRPRWIALLLLALALAAGFAALGRWQLERGVVAAHENVSGEERAVPLDSLTGVQEPVLESMAGRLVEVEGRLVPGEYTVFSDREQRGEPGYWVVGHLVTVEGDSLAVALGWAETEARARAAIPEDEQGGEPAAELLRGRYLPSESPQQSDFEAGERSAVSIAELINEWAEVDAVYGGYLVSDAALPGLAVIHSPPPTTEVEVNWLNVFYAAEWVLFAGFAVYLWYRLVKDAWEREEHEAAEAVTGG